MDASRSEPPALFTRVERGGVVRRLGDGALGTPELVREWEGIGVMKLRSPAFDLPEGALANHSFTLNLGGPAQVEVSIDGGVWEAVRAAPGAVSLLPAHLPYAVHALSAFDVLLVEIAPSVADALAGGPAALAPSLAFRDPLAEHVLLALAAEARDAAPAGAARAEKLAAVLVTHLAERAARRPEPPPAALLTSAPLRRVLAHVAAHLDTPLPLARLADLVGMDVFAFTRAFKASVGTSPHRYVVEARIARAKELLADRSLPITEVALASGFATPSHFSVTFRRLVGLTPREFRERVTGRRP